MPNRHTFEHEHRTHQMYPQNGYNNMNMNYNNNYNPQMMTSSYGNFGGSPNQNGMNGMNNMQQPPNMPQHMMQSSYGNFAMNGNYGMGGNMGANMGGHMMQSSYGNFNPYPQHQQQHSGNMPPPPQQAANQQQQQAANQQPPPPQQQQQQYNPNVMHMNNMLMASNYGGWNNNNNMNAMAHMNNMQSNYGGFNPMLNAEYALRRTMSTPNVGPVANAAVQSASNMELCYDDTIRLIDGREAEIKFIGTIGYRADLIWYGIALKTPTGNTNGMQQGRAFFTCNPGHGLFVNAHQIAMVLKQSSGPRLSYGKRVTCNQGTGVLRFVGLVENRQNSSRRLLYGIDLDKEIRGGHNGNYQNVQYFLARDFHGYFAPEEEISTDTSAKPKKKRMKKRGTNESLHSNSSNGSSNNQFGRPQVVNDFSRNAHSPTPHSPRAPQSPPSFGMSASRDSSSDGDETDAERDTQTEEDVQLAISSTNFNSILERYKSKQTQKKQMKVNKTVPLKATSSVPQNVDQQPKKKKGGMFANRHLRGNTVSAAVSKNNKPPPAPKVVAVSGNTSPKSSIQPHLYQSQSPYVSADPPAQIKGSDDKKTNENGQRLAPLSPFPATPFDVNSTQEDFNKVANEIFSAYNNPRGLFKLLNSLAVKLKLAEAKYRILDPMNPAVQKKVFKREDTKDMEGDVGPESVKEFLKLLGFADNGTGLLVCPHDQPPVSVINAASNVCKLWIAKCNDSRKALWNIRKYSKNVNALSKEIEDTLAKKNIKMIGGGGGAPPMFAGKYGNARSPAFAFNGAGKVSGGPPPPPVDKKKTGPPVDSARSLPELPDEPEEQVAIKIPPERPQNDKKSKVFAPRSPRKASRVPTSPKSPPLSRAKSPPPPPPEALGLSKKKKNSKKDAKSPKSPKSYVPKGGKAMLPMGANAGMIAELRANLRTSVVSRPASNTISTSASKSESRETTETDSSALSVASGGLPKLSEVSSSGSGGLPPPDDQEMGFGGGGGGGLPKLSDVYGPGEDIYEDEEKVDDDVDGDGDQFQLREIVWSVTNPDNVEHANVRDVLLLCFPTFTHPQDILHLLVARFLEKDEDATPIEHKQVQLRVVSFLQHWMRKFYYQDFYLFADVDGILDDFCERIRNYHTGDEQAKGEQLARLIENTMNVQHKKLEQKGMLRDTEKRKKKLESMMGVGDQEAANLSIKHKDRATNKLMDQFYKEKEKRIAQQFVLMAFKRFSAIEPRECLEQSWKGAEKEQRAPNILDVIDHFNKISNWISMTILSAPNASKRGKWITKWLKIADILFEYHDFQTLAAIHGALTSQSVFRQSVAWKKVPAKYVIKFEEFKVIYNARAGHSNLRKIHRETPPPMIPYAGVLLQVLFQIDEGNKSKRKDGSVNFSKLMRLHTAIQRIQLLQQSNYDNQGIKADEKTQKFLEKCVSHFAHMNTDQIYGKSTEALNKDDPKRAAMRASVKK